MDQLEDRWQGLPPPRVTFAEILEEEAKAGEPFGPPSPPKSWLIQSELDLPVEGALVREVELDDRVGAALAAVLRTKGWRSGELFQLIIAGSSSADMRAVVRLFGQWGGVTGQSSQAVR